MSFTNSSLGIYWEGRFEDFSGLRRGRGDSSEFSFTEYNRYCALLAEVSSKRPDVRRARRKLRLRSRPPSPFIVSQSAQETKLSPPRKVSGSSPRHQKTPADFPSADPVRTSPGIFISHDGDPRTNFTTFKPIQQLS